MLSIDERVRFGEPFEILELRQPNIRLVHGVSPNARGGRRVRHLPDGHRRVPQAVPGLGQERHAARLRARPLDPDAGVWTHWVLWAFGGKLVDLQGWIVIDSAQTLAALEYARELYQTFVPGTTSWLDPDNNEAFLAGRISLTANGVSIYHAAKNSDDPGLKAIAEDIRHANFPVGPVGTPTELFLISQAMVFNHTPHPNAAKAYLRFMWEWEREQYEPWQKASPSVPFLAGTAFQPVENTPYVPGRTRRAQNVGCW